MVVTRALRLVGQLVELEIELLSHLDKPLLAMLRTHFLADRSEHGEGNTAYEPQQGLLVSFLLCKSLMTFCPMKLS